MLVRGTPGIGIKQLKAAIASKYGDKSVWVMDSDEMGKIVRLNQIKIYGSLDPETTDLFMNESNNFAEILTKNKSNYKHCVFIDYGLYSIPMEIVDARVIMGMRYNDQEFRKCYLDMCLDVTSIDVAGINSVLNNMSLDDVRELWLLGDVAGYQPLRAYDVYKSSYMFGISGSIEEGFKALAIDDAIKYVLELLNGAQHIDRPSTSMTNEDREKLFRSFPLVDPKWYEAHQERRSRGRAAYRRNEDRRRRKYKKALQRRSQRHKKKHRHHHDKSTKRHHHHDKHKSTKRHHHRKRHGSNRKSRR